MADSFLFHFFHNETNDRTERGLVQIPEDAKDWPEEWKKIEYKQYRLFPPIALPKKDSALFDLLCCRRSGDGSHIPENRISPDILSTILRCGYGVRENKDDDVRLGERRTAPSAGALYPLEMYPVLFKDVGSLRPGVYHYGIREHALEPVVFGGLGREEIESILYREWLANTTGMICISAVFSRSTGKYGSRGYRYILLEAGHVAQNILLAGAENNVDIIPIGGVDEVGIERKIGLTDSNERIVYTLFF